MKNQGLFLDFTDTANFASSASVTMTIKMTEIAAMEGSMLSLTPIHIKRGNVTTSTDVTLAAILSFHPYYMLPIHFRWLEYVTTARGYDWWVPANMPDA